MFRVPGLRIAACNQQPVRENARFVLYWMTAFRRVTHNFSLDRALEWAERLGKPLIVLEALRAGYPWANDRLHTFILEGMADNAARLAATPARYYPYVEPAPGAGKGLLGALASEAAVVLTDEFPCFFLPQMVEAAAARVPVLLEQVDSNGLLPLRATDRVFSTAHSFRSFLQKSLMNHLGAAPRKDPLAKADVPRAKPIPRAILERWPPASMKDLRDARRTARSLPIDHAVGPAELVGGTTEAEKRLRRFVSARLGRYPDDRNEPETEGTSKLSPYLHFGHVSAHDVFARVMKHENWSPESVSAETRGSRAGFWGASPAAEQFLDQLVTWRELGYNMCHKRADYAHYDSLPTWAKRTLATHARDRRSHVYTLGELEGASTHDSLWNAAQTQLVRDGWFHNYMRMLWGKKILEWSATPHDALAAMIHLMNKYALDGRNPNSYTGYFWTLGRYDRPWGPERPVFGSVRYMSSENSARKLHVKNYVAKYTPASSPNAGAAGKPTTIKGRRR